MPKRARTSNSGRFRRRRTPFRRTAKRRAIAMRHVPRAMTPKVHFFKRDLEETLLLSSSAAPEGWVLENNNRVYRNLAWSLGSVGNPTDFSNLFRQYKIKAARMRFYCSNTQASGQNAAGGFQNTQLLFRMAPNQRGDIETLDNEYWQQIQAKKYQTGLNGGKPLDVYMPLMLRNEVQSSTGSSTCMIKPKFISTSASNVAHYGLNIAIERVDGQGFSAGSATNYQYVKVITTLYFEMRGVE